jgi:hypothetical protein
MTIRAEIFKIPLPVILEIPVLVLNLKNQGFPSPISYPTPNTTPRTTEFIETSP